MIQHSSSLLMIIRYCFFLGLFPILIINVIPRILSVYSYRSIIYPNFLPLFLLGSMKLATRSSIVHTVSILRRSLLILHSAYLEIWGEKEREKMFMDAWLRGKRVIICNSASRLHACFSSTWKKILYTRLLSHLLFPSSTAPTTTTTTCSSHFP